MHARLWTSAERSHGLSLSLSPPRFFSFSTWIGISMNHLVGACSVTLVVRRTEKLDARQVRGFLHENHGKDKLDFLIRRQHHRGWALRSLEFQREILRLLVLGPEEVARVEEGLRKTEWGKGVIWLYVEKEAYPQRRCSLQKMRLITCTTMEERRKIFSILRITVEDLIPSVRGHRVDRWIHRENNITFVSPITVRTYCSCSL